MEKIIFEDLPSTETPLNAENLNQIQINMENAINELNENLENLENKITETNNKFNYSTEEQIIGKWTDNSTLYQQTISGNTPSETNNWVDVVEVGTGLKIKELTGIMRDYMPIPIYASNEYFLALQYKNGYIQIYSSGFVNMPFELTIKYTKITD